MDARLIKLRLAPKNQVGAIGVNSGKPTHGHAAFIRLNLRHSMDMLTRVKNHHITCGQVHSLADILAIKHLGV